jgi:hypothetical protein
MRAVVYKSNGEPVGFVDIDECTAIEHNREQLRVGVPQKVPEEELREMRLDEQEAVAHFEATVSYSRSRDGEQGCRTCVLMLVNDADAVLLSGMMAPVDIERLRRKAYFNGYCAGLKATKKRKAKT